MVDGKSLLDSIVAAASQSGQGQAAAGGGGGLFGNILGQLEQSIAQGTQGAGAQGQGQAGAAGGGMLGNVLGQLQSSLGTGQAGGIADIAKQVLGQATQGVRESAQQIDGATGASGKFGDIVKQVSGGKSAGDLINQAKDLVQNNQAAAGALAGILGGMLLGTRAGRSLTMDAAKVGGLVLIGGLAYKAYQNHQAGKPMLGGDAKMAPVPAPAGSGFEPAAQTNDNALLYLSAMISAAAADGRIDAGERSKILGNLASAGIQTDGTVFLEQAFANPASIDQLAAQATSPETRTQVYTAARVAIDPDTDVEQAWLNQLAARLGLEPGLRANIDEAVGGMKA